MVALNAFGQNIKITLFGESHGPALGIVIDGLAGGITIDETLIQNQLKKRRPKSVYSTSRIEDDEYEILSGIYEGKTTGAPITFLIKNTNTHSKDYFDNANSPRPSHADYPAFVKYNGFNDPRGGGIFSGRITSLFMIIGSISKQILNPKNIFVGSHIQSIKNIEDNSFDFAKINDSLIKKLETLDFPVINSDIEASMKELILSAKNDDDSVGGVIESAIINLPAGIGEPLFLSVESYLSSLIFSIPSVKGIEFGLGFNITKKYGHEVNDNYTIENHQIKTTSNNNGGILGGISTGMPLIIRVAIKPTPSIGKIQKSINLKTNELVDLEIKGRHDPAIVNRVVHVINSVLYFGILDLLLFSKPKEWML